MIESCQDGYLFGFNCLFNCLDGEDVAVSELRFAWNESRLYGELTQCDGELPGCRVIWMGSCLSRDLSRRINVF